MYLVVPKVDSIFMRFFYDTRIEMDTHTLRILRLLANELKLKMT